MFNQDCRSLVAQKCFLFLRNALRSHFCSKEKSTSKKKSEQLRRNMPPLQFALPRGALAQLVRAPPCHGGGCGFEPRRLRNSAKITVALCEWQECGSDDARANNRQSRQ